MIEQKSIKNSWYSYVWYFLVYCIIGWIYEVIWEFAVGNGFVNRGFLKGPYLPIYGFGILILLFLLRKLLSSKIKIGKINLRPILVFLAILVIVSVIEYIASWGMELLFHKRWWDYSYDMFNLNGRISLRNSSLLALGGFLLLTFIQPILQIALSKMDKKVLKIGAITIMLVMSIDLALTLIGYIR